MNELTLQLKNTLIYKLTCNESLLNERYLVSGHQSWTRAELAKEIQDETEFGIGQMTKILMLSVDLISRQKEAI